MQSDVFLGKMYLSDFALVNHSCFFALIMLIRLSHLSFGTVGWVAN